MADNTIISSTKTHVQMHGCDRYVYAWFCQTCRLSHLLLVLHEGVLTWQHFPHYYPCGKSVTSGSASHRISNVEIWFFFVLARRISWTHCRVACDSRRHEAYVMRHTSPIVRTIYNFGQISLICNIHRSSASYEAHSSAHQDHFSISVKTPYHTI